MATRFPKGARVCFVGDSITYDNTYLAHIVSYYKKHFPEDCVEFYNCGIPGCELKTTLAVFDEDVAAYKPTHLVLLMGANDCCISWLLEDHAKQYVNLKEIYENFQKNIARFCELAKKIGAELTLCTPVPHDEYQKSDEQLYPGAYALLMGYANFVRNFARENGYPLCDYHPYIAQRMHGETLFNTDRVHPNSRGQYYMAKCFLEFQGLDLGEEEPFSEEIVHWRSVVSDIRNTITAEHFFLKDDFSKTHEERKEIISKYVIPDDCFNPTLFKELLDNYPARKAKQAENIQFTIDFMRNPK